MEESVKSRIPVLFCHVPLAGRPFSVAEMTRIILQLVEIMLDETHLLQDAIIKHGEAVIHV